MVTRRPAWPWTSGSRWPLRARFRCLQSPGPLQAPHPQTNLGSSYGRSLEQHDWTTALDCHARLWMMHSVQIDQAGGGPVPSPLLCLELALGARRLRDCRDWQHGGRGFAKKRRYYVRLWSSLEGGTLRAPTGGTPSWKSFLDSPSLLTCSVAETKSEGRLNAEAQPIADSCWEPVGLELPLALLN